MTSGEYPDGITTSDHIAHDMRAGRFPEQSSVALFLAELRIATLESQLQAAEKRVEELTAAFIKYDDLSGEIIESIERRDFESVWQRNRPLMIAAFASLSNHRNPK